MTTTAQFENRLKYITCPGPGSAAFELLIVDEITRTRFEITIGQLESNRRDRAETK
jgi:hypothetical protein